ncbi:hypothetical protein GCM10023212_15610 [Luteolibacter yonseiensis]
MADRSVSANKPNHKLMKTLITSTATMFAVATALTFMSTSCVDRAGEPGSRMFGNPKTQSTQTTGKKPSDGR